MTVCPVCGYENPEAWTACAACGHERVSAPIKRPPSGRYFSPLVCLLTFGGPVAAALCPVVLSWVDVQLGVPADVSADLGPLIMLAAIVVGAIGAAVGSALGAFRRWRPGIPGLVLFGFLGAVTGFATTIVTWLVILAAMT